MAFIYTFTSSLDNKVFYVGKAFIDDRIKSHFKAAQSKKVNVSLVAIRIREIQQQGGQVIVDKPYRQVSDHSVFILEKLLIEHYGYEQLVNLPPSDFGRSKGLYPRHWDKLPMWAKYPKGA